MTDSWSRGHLESTSRCPACGSHERTITQFSRKDNDGVLPETWRYVECAHCHSLYLDPRPTADSIGKAYQEYYTHVASEGTVSSQSGQLLLSPIHGYLRLRFGMKRLPASRLLGALFYLIEPLRLKLDYYGRHLPHTPGHLFDVGCGNGDFLLRAKDMGWNVAGCDPDPKAVAEARQRGLDVRCAPSDYIAQFDERWDVITVGHVIEHMYDPAKLLLDCHNALRPGGNLWLATPNPTSPGFRQLGKYWIPLHPPFHLCIIHPAQLKKMLEHASFSNTRFLRRGMQSPNQWREALAISKREGDALPITKLWSIRLLSDIQATLSPLGGEETVIVAKRK